jgi:hypothetical protein
MVKNVDFPDPDGPVIMTISPASTVRETPFKIGGSSGE